MKIRSLESKTGGRAATMRHIPPKLALAVGMPNAKPPKGWKWSDLSKIARLESGHTPSRKHPEYWGGTIPWISISDGRANHGATIFDTRERTNKLGLANSSARLLPKATVCLSRTASVGYVVVMGEPMATSQDFVNWVCSKDLDPNFLKYLFIAEGEGLLRFSSGAVHQTIYFPEVKAFHICHPNVDEQRRIVAVLDEAFAGLATAQANAEKNLQNARALFESQLDYIFNTVEGDWPETTLGAEIELLSGFAFKSASYTTFSEDVRLLGGDNIVQGALRWEDVRRWPVSDLTGYERFLLSEGDVVLAMDRPWVKAGLKCAQVDTGDLPCLLVQRTARLRGGTKLTNRFLFYLINCRSFIRHILGVQTGIGVPHISGQQIKDFKFRRPPLERQIEFIELLDTLALRTKQMESIYARKLAAIAELKKSLLHQAFSGNL